MIIVFDYACKLGCAKVQAMDSVCPTRPASNLVTPALIQQFVKVDPCRESSSMAIANLFRGASDPRRGNCSQQSKSILSLY